MNSLLISLYIYSILIKHIRLNSYTLYELVFLYPYTLTDVLPKAILSTLSEENPTLAELGAPSFIATPQRQRFELPYPVTLFQSSSAIVCNFSSMLLLRLLARVVVFATAACAHPRPTCGDGERGAVASESAVCSNIGISILKEGGNAADAVRSFYSSFLPLFLPLTISSEEGNSSFRLSPVTRETIRITLCASTLGCCTRCLGACQVDIASTV